jgi:hypothetical protein
LADDQWTLVESADLQDRIPPIRARGGLWRSFFGTAGALKEELDPGTADTDDGEICQTISIKVCGTRAAAVPVQLQHLRPIKIHGRPLRPQDTSHHG